MKISTRHIAVVLKQSFICMEILKPQEIRIHSETFTRCAKNVQISIGNADVYERYSMWESAPEEIPQYVLLLF